MKKIIILGAGQVGISVAESLILEKNDVTVIDKDAVKLNALQSRLDLRAVVGNAGHPSVLIDAGIEDCELLIAVTEVDEINMMACKIAHGIFSVPTRIARIRSNEYLKDKRLSDVDMFSINHVICPEQILTDYVLKLVQFPEALQVLEFANGLVSHRSSYHCLHATGWDQFCDPLSGHFQAQFPPLWHGQGSAIVLARDGT
jgi:trk system potassium uptake protein TrkA